MKANAEQYASDLRIIEALVPEISNLQGELKLKITAAGTVNQPVLSRNAGLGNGSMQIPGLGLNIEQITFNSQSNASKTFNFVLNARSGDGKLAVSGQTLLDRSAGWPTE